jgi:DNA-binding NtrC family response regulator
MFLDEIGEMSPAMQTRLLRVLQEGEYRPVGSTEDRRVDVRVLAATNRDLAREVEAGNFREDLYYRLNVVTIKLPPLAERLEDLPLLAEHVLEQFSGEMGGAKKRISRDAMDVLLGHSWPGNVRELENVLKNAAILARGDELGPEDIHLTRHAAADEPAASTLNLSELERQTIHKVLKLTGGNKTRAAEILGISRLTLYRKLKED